MKNGILAICIMSLLSLQTKAQDSPTVNVDLSGRASYINDRIGSEVQHANSGMKGDYLDLSVYGDIGKGFSYAWRQMLNRKIENNNFFDATAWVYITYKATEHWSIEGGKQVLLIGGFEYDRTPMDIYTASEYWYNIGCYQFGASTAYHSRNDKLTLQFSESPFRQPDRHDMYAYNLYWTGNHGFWKTLYSLNMMEYAPDKYISYIALGNHFDIGRFALELDYMNRAASHQTYFFKDCSVMAELKYRPVSKLSLYGKVTYDVNHAGTDADKCVMDGTELTTVAGGLEFWPIKGKEDVRLNLGVAHTTGKNGNPNGRMVDDKLTVQVGVSAKLNLFRYSKN